VDSSSASCQAASRSFGIRSGERPVERSYQTTAASLSATGIEAKRYVTITHRPYRVFIIAQVAAASQRSRRANLLEAIGKLVSAIESNDEAALEALLSLSRKRRIFAPLAFMVGAFAMLFAGLRVLATNWRLMLIQIPPAVWIWLAMFDLKIHVLHGRSFHLIRGPILIPIGLAIVAVTAVGFFLNAVFAFAIAGSRPPNISVAIRTARTHLTPILISGNVVGALLAVATSISPRWGPPWFTVTLGAVVAVMMVCYVAVPARLIGARKVQSRRDKVTASLLSSAFGVAICTPPYTLGRIGILMLGSRLLIVPGIVFMLLGFTLQAGATGAVRAIKLGAVLTAGASAGQAAGRTRDP
jgi:hypothetical protein